MEIPRKLERVLKKLGTTVAEAFLNKNYETVVIGCELLYLRDVDIMYLLDEGISVLQATNRLVSRMRVC